MLTFLVRIQLKRPITKCPTKASPSALKGATLTTMDPARVGMRTEPQLEIPLLHIGLDLTQKVRLVAKMHQILIIRLGQTTPILTRMVSTTQMGILYLLLHIYTSTRQNCAKTGK